MTKTTSPDLLDLAEAVADGRLRVDDAEREIRGAPGPGHANASEKAVRELRQLVAAARAVRSHASATREAWSPPTPGLADTTTATTMAAGVPGPVRAGAARRRSSSGGDRRATRRTWLLVAATLVLGGGVVGASVVGGRATVPTPVPPSPNGVALASASPRISATTSAMPPAATSATRIGPGSWAATGSMLTPRSGATATLLSNGKVLVAGGSNASGPLAKAELYDPPTGVWTATGTMSTPRTGHTATLLPDGKVLVAGGKATLPRGLNEPPSLASAELYDPVTGSWTATGTMTAPRSSQTATLLDDSKVLVAGGASTVPTLASAELYDPAAGIWTATGSMATSRTGQAATLLADGTVLVAGGGTSFQNGDGTSGGSDLLTAEMYGASSGSWSTAGRMRSPAGGLTAVLLPNGRVLHVGVPCDLFDPAKRSWVATGSMRTPRGGEGVIMLSNGKVLVEGGAGGGSVGIASAELYDPATGAWAATASPVMGSQGATATLLLDGRVLVAGGFGVSGTLSSAELYEPGSD